MIQAIYEDSDNKYILSNGKVDLLLFEVTVDEHKKANEYKQYNHIVFNTGRTDTMAFILFDELSASVPFGDFDADSVTYRLTVTEYMQDGKEYEAISSLLL